MVGVETSHVALVQIEGRDAFYQPLGHRFADAACMGYPDRLGRPETLDLRPLAQDGKAVVCERKDAVDLVSKPDVFESRYQFTGCHVPFLEVRPREWHDGWLIQGLVVRQQIVGLD